MSKPLAFLSMMICIVLFAGCSVIQPTATGTQTATAEHMSDSSLVVESRNGSVEIIADRAIHEVQVTAKITCAGDTQAQADQRLAEASISIERSTQRALTIKPIFPGGHRGNDGANLTIRIPDAQDVQVDTSNGRVEVNGLRGEMIINTSNGAVTLIDHNGPATIATSNGNIEVQRLAGPLTARTSNARVSADHVAGAVQIKSSNGPITLTLGLDQPGPIDLRTSNASITAKAGGAFEGTVKFNTSNGSINVDDRAKRVKSRQLDKNPGSIIIGEDSQSSVLETSNGSIELTIDS